MKKLLIIILFFTINTISSCAPIKPNYEEPSVVLKSFRIVPSQQSLLPGFEIGLHLINPNRTPLPLKGIFYTVSLEGQKVLSGVASDLPTIKGYGEEDILLHATADLLGGVKLMNRFLNGYQPTLKYKFNAKIDMGRFSPTMNIEEKGTLNTMLRLERE